MTEKKRKLINKNRNSMQKKFIPFKFKAALALCLFVSANCLTAQKTSNYKYMITPVDTGWTGNYDVLG